MEIRHIISFQKVATLNGFSKASKALFLSQPTITKHINELEKSLGARLLVRDNNAIELTEAGIEFLNYANQLIAIHDEAIAATTNIVQGKKTSIKLALSGPDCHWLLPMLEKFKKYYSDVDIHLSILWGKEVIERLLKRELHFGVIRSDIPSFFHQHLNAISIEEDEAILIFSPQHRLAQLKEITMADIYNEPYLAYGKGTSFWNNQLLQIYHNAGYEPQVSLESSDYQVIKLLVRASWGISFLSRPCVQEELDNGLIKTSPVKDCLPIKRYSVLVYRKDLTLNKTFQSFLNMTKRNDHLHGNA